MNRYMNPPDADVPEEEQEQEEEETAIPEEVEAEIFATADEWFAAFIPVH
jgi:hypothetical protein